MLNEDLNYGEQKEHLLDAHKVKVLQDHSKQVVIDFLKKNHINYVELKDGSLKFSSENLKQLFNLLKRNMSDKRTEALQYKQEKDILRKIHKFKELKIRFATNDNDDFQTLYLYLHSPILSMITKGKQSKTIYTIVSHTKYQGCYAVIYRVDFKQLKPKSYLRTVILDRRYGFVDEVDYFNFVDGCHVTHATIDVDFEAVKSRSTRYIIKSMERQKSLEAENQNRLIDVKIDSIQNYFDKQIAKAKKLEESVSHADVKRMRMGEVVNLEKQRDRKIEELEEKKVIGGSFEILGVLSCL